MSLQVKIINLDSRRDRWAEVSKEMERIGITGYERFSALIGKSGENGCALSHYACLCEKTGPILLLEDDVYFENPEIIPDAMKQLPAEWDLLYLGANVKTPATRYSENLYRITGGVHCTHAILYSAKGRKRMTEVWNPNNKEHHQIDHWMYMIGQSLLNCFVIHPLVAWQRSSYSDVRLQDFDYRKEMEENAKINMA